MSEKVKILADSITKGCEDDFEKCKALERYLYQYHYTKIIDMPDDVNVLDWFLFEGKEGYCVHYATALAVMLRCEGIPSRIVEGFLVDYEDETNFYEYMISGNKAHAWVEAYIDGFGWVRLEPTVVNAQNANMVWYADTETAQEEETEESDDSVFAEELHSEEEQTDSKENVWNVWFMMLMMLCGMAVMIMSILLILFLRRRNDIRRSNDPDVILQHLLWIFGRKISPKEDSETLSEYFKRISSNEQITEEMCAELVIIRDRMEPYWYGKGHMGADDVRKMKEIIDQFKKTK